MTQSATGEKPLQPLLNDAVVALRAPTQVWSASSGDLGRRAIHGVYHGDTRQIRELTLTYGGIGPEWISVAPHSASHVVFGGLLRAVDDDFPDPKVRILRSRVVGDARVRDTLTVSSHVAHAITTDLRVRLVPEFASLQEVKAGLARARAWKLTRDGATDEARVESGDRSFTISAPGAAIAAEGDSVSIDWPIRLEPGESVEVSCSIGLHDPSLVVRGVPRPPGWTCRGSAATREFSGGSTRPWPISRLCGCLCPIAPRRSSSAPARLGS